MQTLISGLSDGAIYGLIAMGMSITFYVTRVINFAHGQLLMVAVMVIAEGTLAHWALGLSILLAFVAAAGIAVLTYLIAVRPVIRRNRFNIIWVASTLGVSIILENGAAYFFGSDTVPFPVLLQNDTFTVGGLTISWQQVLAFFLALALGARLRNRAEEEHARQGRHGCCIRPGDGLGRRGEHQHDRCGRVRPLRHFVRGGGCPARPVLVRQPVHG